MFSLANLRLLSRSFSRTNRPKVFFDIAIDNEPQGRLIFELYDDIVPKTADNFRKLCIGAGNAKTAPVPLHYKGSIFHRIFEGFMCQGGDIIKHNGTGGESIYGPSFPDENYNVKLDKPGMLAMLPNGPNSNDSRFFITFIDCSFLDTKYVGFGELVDGQTVLNQIEYCGNSVQKGTPKKEVKVIDCGEIKPVTNA